jgi:hypothetical protein
MPAVSKKQRRAMAIAEHDPGALYPENKGLAQMTTPQLHDFAVTKEKGLPERVKSAKKRSTPPRHGRMANPRGGGSY